MSYQGIFINHIPVVLRCVIDVMCNSYNVVTGMMYGWGRMNDVCGEYWGSGMISVAKK